MPAYYQGRRASTRDKITGSFAAFNQSSLYVGKRADYELQSMSRKDAAMSNIAERAMCRDGLLTKGPLIPRSNRDGMVAGLESIYRVRQVDIGASDSGFAGEANRIALPGVVLHYCHYEAPANVTFGDMPGHRQFFPLSGTGRLNVDGTSIDLSTGTSGVVRPGSTFNAEYGAGYSHLVVQIDESLLQEKSERVIGEEWARFKPAANATLDGVGSWRIRQIAMALASQFACDRPHSPLLIAELEQALLSTFLYDHLHAAATPLTSRQTHSETMRRLEGYVEDNWQRDITVEDLAAACGMSVRSVFSYFKRQRNATPLAFLREVRLTHAKALLDRGGDRSVLDIAQSCGFANFGHFAQRYRERYGELPSHTLRRAKSGTQRLA